MTAYRQHRFLSRLESTKEHTLFRELLFFVIFMLKKNNSTTAIMLFPFLEKRNSKAMLASDIKRRKLRVKWGTRQVLNKNFAWFHLLHMIILDPVLIVMLEIIKIWCSKKNFYFSMQIFF